MHFHSLTSQLGRRLAIAIFSAIVLVEAVIFIPSFGNRQDELYRRTADTSQMALAASLQGQAPGIDAEALGPIASALFARAALRGLALYHAQDGALVATVGEAPTAEPGAVQPIRRHGDLNVVHKTADRFEVIWTPAALGAPYTAVGRLDDTGIEAALAAFMLRMAGLVLVTGAFATLVLMLLLDRLVMRRLLAVRQALLDIAAQPMAERTLRVNVHGGDEFDDVKRALNTTSAGIADNIRELQRQTDALRRSEARFQRIFQAAQDAIFICDAASERIVDVNRRAAQLVDYPQSELKDTPIATLHPHDNEKVIDFIRRIGEGGGTFTEHLSCRRKNGVFVPVEISASNIELDGKPRVMLIARDISERRKIEAKLIAAKETAEHANQAKSAFLANCSHELRTPLNAILGFSELILTLKGQTDSGKVQDYINDIHASAQWLHSLIDDLLDISKLEMGQKEVVSARLDLVELCDEMARMFRPDASDRGIFLLVDVPADLPVLWADEKMVRQILQNLLANAVKFTPAGGRVDFTAQRGPDGLTLSVGDSGYGIPALERERIFEAFYRGEGAHTRKHTGSGLGLFIVKRWADLHGATVDIDSRDGEGTRISVTFPPARLIDDEPGAKGAVAAGD